MINLDTSFDYGDIVYIKTDPHQFARIITGVLVRRDHHVYECALANLCTYHSDFELSSDRLATHDIQY